jgi:hypothetical protein
MPRGASLCWRGNTSSRLREGSCGALGGIPDSFQPAHRVVLRVAAPHRWRWSSAPASRAWWRARARRRSTRVEREFDRGGKALFMGFVMVAATMLAWLLVSQAIPATLTALAGAARTEPGVVSRRVPATSDADCRFRLVVAQRRGGRRRGAAAAGRMRRRAVWRRRPTAAR